MFNNKALGFMLPVLTLAGAILLWFLISYFNVFPAYTFPSPIDVFNSFREEVAAGRLVNDIITSL